MVITNRAFTKIIKIAGEDNLRYYGYNAVNGLKFDYIMKGDAINISKDNPVVKALCGDELARLNVAEFFFPKNIDKKKFLNITERTIYRLKNKQC